MWFSTASALPFLSMVISGMAGDFHVGNAISRSFGGTSFGRIAGATSAIFAGYGRRAGRLFESGSTNWRMTRPRALGESFSPCPNQEGVHGDLAERRRSGLGDSGGQSGATWPRRVARVGPGAGDWRAGNRVLLARCVEHSGMGYTWTRSTFLLLTSD